MDAPELLAVKRARADSFEPSTVVLVEGASDQAALETLARRRGRDLGVEGVAIVPMGGATTIGHFLDLLGHMDTTTDSPDSVTPERRGTPNASWSGPALAST
jgi:hypothetical protein